MALEYQHKTHLLVFREDDETWFHKDVGYHKSLKAAKQAVDNLSRKDRQVGVKALRLGNRWEHKNNKIVEVTVTTLAEPRAPSRFDKAPPQVTECFITYGNKQREKVDISNLYPVDSRMALKTYVLLMEQAEAAQEKAVEYLKRIVHYDADTLALAAKEQKAAEESGEGLAAKKARAK